jgi:flavin reductase (DIM6/NTAB) family NADH-FMN oxidoreductase RutF
MEEFDSTELDARTNARIMKSAVSPRPIAWISTISDDGTPNLAPFSSYNYVGSDQPVVLFNTPIRESNGLKDTAQNALTTGEFAVNVITEPFLEKMDHTSASIPSDESEFDLADIESAECRYISPPCVADAVATLECTLYDSLEIYDRLMIIGDVQYYHISNEVMTDGDIDSRKLDTVGRLGGPYYSVADPIDYERQF